MRSVRFSLLVERGIVWICRYSRKQHLLSMGERAYESQTFAIGVGVYTLGREKGL